MILSINHFFVLLCSLFDRLMKLNPNKIILFTLIIIFVSISSIFGALLLRTNRVHDQFLAKEHYYKNSLVTIQCAIGKKEQYLQKMAEDSEFAERVVRQKLGYAEPDEIVFRFPHES